MVHIFRFDGRETQHASYERTAGYPARASRRHSNADHMQWRGTFSLDGSVLVTASYDGSARFLDSESGMQPGPALHHADAVLCTAFHPDGQTVVTGTRDGMVQRWSTPSPLKSGGGAEIRRWGRAQIGAGFDDRQAETTRTLGDR